VHFDPHIVRQLAAPQEVPAVGTTPPGFDADVSAYRHINVLSMIIFYNDDFGILQADPLSARLDKFRRFLTRF
jgi:hypothetical protein